MNESTVHQDKGDTHMLQVPSVLKDFAFKALEICINYAQIIPLSKLLAIRFMTLITKISDVRESMHELCELCIISPSPQSSTASAWQPLNIQLLTQGSRTSELAWQWPAMWPAWLAMPRKLTTDLWQSDIDVTSSPNDVKRGKRPTCSAQHNQLLSFLLITHWLC